MSAQLPDSGRFAPDLLLEGVRAARKGGKVMRQCDREQLLGIQRRIERKLRLFEEKPRFFRIPDEKRMAYRAGYDAAAACMLAWARDQIAELLERLPADE